MGKFPWMGREMRNGCHKISEACFAPRRVTYGWVHVGVLVRLREWVRERSWLMEIAARTW
jgi:hypothetical protein